MRPTDISLPDLTWIKVKAALAWREAGRIGVRFD
jgi:hypothetical protein